MRIPIRAAVSSATNYILIPLFILALVLSACAPPAQQTHAPLPRARAYVDPALHAGTAKELSAIVTGISAQAAAAAVNAIGGHVTSDLWLINAVAATFPAGQISALAEQSGVVSVVENKGVAASSGPQCDPDVVAEHGPCASRDGWVTDRRERQSEVELPHNQKTPLVRLSDGRIVAVGEKDTVTFINSDGTVAGQATFPFKSDGTAPAVGADGSIYFTTQNLIDSFKTILYALNPDGSIRWSYEKDKIVEGGVAVSPDGQHVYLATEDLKLYVFDAASGERVVEAKPKGEKQGLVKTGPVVGPDGMVYLQTSGKEPEKTDRRGNLFALDPAVFMAGETENEYSWRYVAVDPQPNGDVLIPLDFAPVVDTANQLVYALSESRKAIIGVDMQDGSQRFLTYLPKKVTAQPLAANGVLYVPTEKFLHVLNSSGQVLSAMEFTAGNIELSPVLSADNTSLFVAAGNILYTVDPVAGTVRWQVPMTAKIIAPPFEDADGNLTVGSEGKDLAVISPSGAVTSRLGMDDKIKSAAMPLTDERYLVQVGDKDLVTVGFLPEEWSGRPDAEATDDDRVWKLSNPIPVDVGADQLHETVLADGNRITGQGVTIAVLDSGIYFDGKVRNILGADLDERFLGQVDFVEYGLCEDGGEQYFADEENTVPLYCFTEENDSFDLYGHGSHVAGIIWSEIVDYATGVNMGIAPEANILSVRILDENGAGTYADAIEGVQYVVENKDAFGIRVINMSLSAYATVPYFIDPLNRAVEAAWAAGLVVVAAAGNEGPGAHTITVPGNDPYVITVGALDNKRTPGYWADDELPSWTATGPTLDGFIKPDILAPGANIISFLYNVDKDGEKAAKLAKNHPDYARTNSLFRMNGTSMATAVTSGVIALMLQAKPNLTPDEVKYRLGYTARPALTSEGTPMYNVFQQGMGRIWAPAAVLANLPEGKANRGMDIQQELNDYADGVLDLESHYQGPVQRLTSDDESADLYYIEEPVLDEQGNQVDTHFIGLGASRNSDRAWMDWEAYTSGMALWSGGMALWSGALNWAGGVTNPAGMALWSGGMPLWSGGVNTWSQGMALWSGGMALWSGGMALWSGGMALWSGGMPLWSGGMALWSGGMALWSGGMALWSGSGHVSATSWVHDDGTVEPQPVPVSAPEEEEEIVYPDNVALCPLLVTLPAVADAAIDADRPTTNYGFEDELKSSPESDAKKHLLYRFDLSGLPGDGIIENAHFLVTSGSSRDSHALVFRAVETPWDESTVTWNQASSGNGWINGSFSSDDIIRHTYDVRVPVGDNTQMSIPLTDLVRDWHKGRRVNAGLILLAVGTDTGDAKWYSRESDKPERRPYLVIDYIDPTEGGCPQESVLSAVADTYIDAKNETNEKGGDSKFKTNPEPGEEKHGLVRFNLAGIPSGVPIHSATLQLTSRSSRNNHMLAVHRMTSNWHGVSTSWSSPHGEDSWASGLFSSADYAPTVYDTFAPVGSDTVVSVNVTALVTEWINNGAPNAGILLLAQGSDTGDAEWYSGNDGSPARHPRLIINWTLPVGWEMPPQSADAFKQPVAVEEEQAAIPQLFLPAVNR